MSYAILISGQSNAVTIKQVVIASHKGSNYCWIRTTTGGRGTDNAWTTGNYADLITHTNLSENIIGEVLSTPLSYVDIVPITNGVIPTVLIQKLTKQYRLRHDTVDTTRTMDTVVQEVAQLIATDPQLLSRYRSDGRSDKNATIKTKSEGEEIMASNKPITHSPIVFNHVERDNKEEGVLAFIPSLTSDSVRNYIPRKFDGLTEEVLYDYAITNQVNVSLHGHAGTGKTTSLMTYAAKKGLEFGSMSCNAGVEPSQFFGRLVPQEDSSLKWSDGLFTHFFRHGGVLVIDEGDFMPQKIASVLHGAIDDRRVLTLLDHNGEIIKAHPNLLIAICWNGNAYKGTSRMNEAFADRFGIKLTFDYDTEIEKQFIPSKTLLELATSMRADSIAGVYETPVSTRLLKNFVQIAQNLSYNFAVENFVNNFREDERASVKLLLDSQRYNLEQELTGKVSE